ncbi:hypothetical protein [Xenorhabdus szentirmaii]|uniref:Uncharacterized protein n=1 Tax=Xenorhabdus szentirmaii DSM 16338 TaxID=1427518 RepID=W1J4H5_9GAMM|nr:MULTISPECIES: hypothetical protein [Xenorhabdus]MBD2780939.1 hypothetical protein [Xenorhabdus sp. 38]MBD2792536.1 hypothetical protein [Xenorhabdus sp. CUL]MBD2805021.1 hypothetical protein [Xenorhabdus sp. ZM]MBD2819219.1 hypothetical protein [Xenorhabdus sp. 42]MBD2823540.1 hypothetical protein [Xenorhabdus sp. 5]
MVSQPELMGAIFGEMSAADIPFVEGEQVMFLWPSILARRAWDSGFFGVQIAAAQPDMALLKVLDDDEYNLWSQRLNLS